MEAPPRHGAPSRRSSRRASWAATAARDSRPSASGLREPPRFAGTGGSRPGRDQPPAQGVHAVKPLSDPQSAGPRLRTASGTVFERSTRPVPPRQHSITNLHTRNDGAPLCRQQALAARAQCARAATLHTWQMQTQLLENIPTPIKNTQTMDVRAVLQSATQREGSRKPRDSVVMLAQSPGESVAYHNLNAQSAMGSALPVAAAQTLVEAIQFLSLASLIIFGGRILLQFDSVRIEQVALSLPRLVLLAPSLMRT